MSEIPEMYTLVCTRWISESMEKGSNWTVTQHQSAKRKGLVQITFMRHNCGRPKKEGKK